MTTSRLYPDLAKPPIIEAVIDIDCDLVMDLDFAAIEAPARQRFGGEYPTFRTRYQFEHAFPVNADEAGEDEAIQARIRRGIHGLVFLQEDGKQLVQVRGQGYSFNRLAPYSNLDEYLPEVKRTWTLYVELAEPVQVTSIRLRYINRIVLPLTQGKVELDDYLKVGPRFPVEDRLSFGAFMNQYVAVETETGNEVKTVLTTQKREGETLPMILDITAARNTALAPDHWEGILDTIQSLRSLKNDVFFNTLEEERCLQLFQ